VRPVQAALLDWYAQHGRDLPWRRTRDPYAILVSELMLQQTQVSRVLPKYLEFLDRFPDFQSLAAASRADVIRAWAPLGYNLRAVRLKTIAEQAVALGGSLSGDSASLTQLKGIGRYTAAAIACFAFEHPVAVLETNVRRVLVRAFLGEARSDTQKPDTLWELARHALPSDRAFDWNQALMDLGATICTARKPRCPVCPLRDECLAHARFGDGLAASPPALREARDVYATAPPVPRRVLRGRLVQLLRGLERGGGMSIAEAARRMAPDKATVTWLEPIVTNLVRDGLVETSTELHGNVADASVVLRLPGDQTSTNADT
jgi:A/G-specific adenine glycosylase